MSTAQRRGARVRTDPRFSRRRRSVERVRRRRIAIRMAATAAVAGLAAAVVWSPLLDVREVRVVGARHTGSGVVVAAAGVEGGENLLFVPTDEIVRRTQALPWVADVLVDRMLPGTVRIKVVERKPAVALSLGAARWTLDAHGHVLAAGGVKKKLPVLAGVQVGTVQPGVRLRTEEAVDALTVLRSLPRGLRREVVALFAPTLERISFKLSDGMVVRYGAAENIAGKNAVLKAVVGRVRAEGVGASYIDVRVPTAPAVSPAAGGAPALDSSD